MKSKLVCEWRVELGECIVRKEWTLFCVSVSGYEMIKEECKGEQSGSKLEQQELR